MNNLSYELLEKEWDYLSSNRIEGLSSKKLPFNSKYDIRIGLDEHMHILVKEEGHKERERMDIADGLGIAFRSMDVKEESAIYFDLSCNPDKKEILLLFIVDFLKIVDDKGPEKAFFTTFNKWRKFWSGKKPRLSNEQQRGLLGELLILQKFITLCSIDSIEYWKGPDNGLRDFEFERIDFEVKTTIREPPVVSINDPEQIAPGSKKLYLLVIQLLPYDSGFSLPDVVKETRNMIKRNEVCLEKYFMLLRSAGYLDSDAPYYLNRYKNTRTIACPIEDTLGIMDPNILRNVPSTVRDIRYKLHVNGLERTITDEKFWKETIEEWL